MSQYSSFTQSHNAYAIEISTCSWKTIVSKDIIGAIQQHDTLQCVHWWGGYSMAKGPHDLMVLDGLAAPLWRTF